MQDPLITIITVVLNDEKNIEKTIQSVLGQKYKNIQYIIIDGNSKDQTKNLINNFKRVLEVINVSSNDLDNLTFKQQKYLINFMFQILNKNYSFPGS